MEYAGVSWNAEGYDVAVVRSDGCRLRATANYPPHLVNQLILDLRELSEPSIVIESTNGTLDGRLMAAGLRVHRADPPLLPSRPPFGSVPAEQLALAALSNPAALVPLEPQRGTQTGREDELALNISSSHSADRAMRSKGRLFSHGHRHRPEIALTFDDGPLPPYTGHVLDVLERYGVPATFFCVGINAASWPEDVDRMRERGHSVGNHTWSHPFLSELSRVELAVQIDRTAEVLARDHPAPAQRLFRPPYGCRTPEVLGWLAEHDDATTVLWDVAPDDWALRQANVIVDRVLAEAQPGSVILLHDGGGDRSPTVLSLPQIIEGLLERGYTFVRVDDMVAQVHRGLVASS